MKYGIAFGQLDQMGRPEAAVHGDRSFATKVGH